MAGMDSGISVVIPTYNRARFIARAIDSVLRQSLPADSIIVVDDGSSDGTLDLLATYKDAVRVIATTNNGSGPSRPRNIGLEAVRTRYVVFLDSDDWMEPCALQEFHDAVVTHPDVGLVCGSYYIETCGIQSREENVPEVAPRIGEQLKEVHVYKISAVAAYEAYCAANFVRFPALFPTAVCRRIGGFDETLSSSNDYDFVLRVLRHHGMTYIIRPLHTYSKHEGNLSNANLCRRYRPELYLNQIRVLQRELAFCQRHRAKLALRRSLRDWYLRFADESRRSCRQLYALKWYLLAAAAGTRWNTVAIGIAKSAIELVGYRRNAQ